MARASADANLGVSSGIERCQENDDVSTNVVVALSPLKLWSLLLGLAANLVKLHIGYSKLGKHRCDKA